MAEEAKQSFVLPHTKLNEACFHLQAPKVICFYPESPDTKKIKLEGYQFFSESPKTQRERKMDWAGIEPGSFSFRCS